MTDIERHSLPEGIFRPQSAVASSLDILKAQALIETKLFLRHGEQQLLSLIIPMGILIGMTLLPFVPLDNPITTVYPLTITIAIMSAGFTGQAIAVAFDRRYGALKRVGASGVPRWALIGGKLLAVIITVSIQIIILTAVALFLGWRINPGSILTALPFLALGVATFTSLGLFLGGTLSSELVLALANTFWFILMGAAILVTMQSDLSGGFATVINHLPSVCLVTGLIEAENQSFAWGSFITLIAWGILGTLCAKKYFRFTMDGD